MRLLAKAYGARWVRKTGHRSPMDTPRDNQDRFMKLMLSRPRMVRDLLALLPAEWTAEVDAASLRELPTEFIGERGCAFPVLTDPIARLGHDSPLADEPRVCILVLKAFISALPSVRPWSVRHVG